MSATAIPDAAAGSLLADLFTAVRPIVGAAAAQHGAEVHQTSALLIASPEIAVFIEHRDAEGKLERVFRLPGEAAVADAYGRFIVRGLNAAVGADVRQKVSQLLNVGAVIAVRLHIDFETASAAIVAGDQEVELFTLSAHGEAN